MHAFLPRAQRDLTSPGAAAARRGPRALRSPICVPLGTGNLTRERRTAQWAVVLRRAISIRLTRRTLPRRGQQATWHGPKTRCGCLRQMGRGAHRLGRKVRAGAAGVGRSSEREAER